LGHEARLQADIRVTTLPEGQDPDEVVNQDPAAWESLLRVARPIVVHVMDSLAKGKDLEDAKVKTEIAAQVLPLIEDLPNPIERDTYLQRLARLLHIDERVLLGHGPPSRRPARPRVRSRGAPQRNSQETFEPAIAMAVPHSDPLEAHCVSVLLRRPDLVYLVDRALQEHGLGRLALDDFQSSDHQYLVRLIEESLEQDHAEPLIYVLNGLSLPLMELADRLLIYTEKLDPNDERVLDDLVRALLVLRRQHLHQHIDHLRFLMQEAQERGDLQAREYQQTIRQYTQARSRLDRAIGHYTAHMIQ
jgi:DNA primase